MPEQPIIYVVDDEAASTASLAALMTAIGHQTALFDCAESFLHQAQPGMRGCLILDVRLPGISGPELCRELHMKGIFLPTILISGHVNGIDKQLFETAPVPVLLQKPYAGKDIIDAVSDALRSVRLKSA